MPLARDASCESFRKNIATLTKEFKAKGKSPEKAQKMAVAAAADIMRKAGGDPASCTKKG